MPRHRRILPPRSPALLAAAGLVGLSRPSGAAADVSVPILWRASLDGSPGWVTHEYAMPDANRCLADTSGWYGSDRDQSGSGLGVVHAYRKVRVTDNGCMSIPWSSPNNHLEGMARIPYPGREIVYFSHIDHGWGSNVDRIARVDLEDAEHLTDDEFLLSTDSGPHAKVTYCQRVGNSLHVGGMQALGDFLFAAIEDKPHSRGRVDIMRVKNGDDLFAEPQVVNQVFMPTGDAAHWVAATRLADGSYFMLVNRANSGRVSMFWTHDPSSTWEFVGDQNLPSVSGAWDPEGERYQNVNLITDCSGKLYLVGLGQEIDINDWDEANEVHMYSLTVSRDAQLRPTLRDIQRAGFFRKSSADNLCQMRGAGAAHVTPSGRLALYCGPHHQINDEQDFEFASIRPPEPEQGVACHPGETKTLPCLGGSTGPGIELVCENGLWKATLDLCEPEAGEGRPDF